jgi:hypothetical protein
MLATDQPTSGTPMTTNTMTAATSRRTQRTGEVCRETSAESCHYIGGDAGIGAGAGRPAVTSVTAGRPDAPAGSFPIQLSKGKASGGRDDGAERMGDDLVEAKATKPPLHGTDSGAAVTGQGHEEPRPPRRHRRANG